MRMFVMAAALACLMTPGARAALITENFQFDNLSTNGGAVFGSFDYDSATGVVTNFQVEDDAGFDLGFGPIPYFASESAPALTFDGTSLNGNVNAFTSVIFLIVEANGSFSGQSGSLDFFAGGFGFLVGTDSVSGSVTFSPAPTAVPEPSTVAGAGLAAGVGLIALRRRRKAA